MSVKKKSVLLVVLERESVHGEVAVEAYQRWLILTGMCVSMCVVNYY